MWDKIEDVEIEKHTIYLLKTQEQYINEIFLFIEDSNSFIFKSGYSIPITNVIHVVPLPKDLNIFTTLVESRYGIRNIDILICICKDMQLVGSNTVKDQIIKAVNTVLPQHMKIDTQSPYIYDILQFLQYASKHKIMVNL